MTKDIPPLVPIHPGTTGLLGVSRRTVYNLLSAGELEDVEIGRRRLIVGESIAAYIERLRKK